MTASPEDRPGVVGILGTIATVVSIVGGVVSAVGGLNGLGLLGRGNVDGSFVEGAAAIWGDAWQVVLHLVDAADSLRHIWPAPLTVGLVIALTLVALGTGIMAAEDRFRRSGRLGTAVTTVAISTGAFVWSAWFTLPDGSPLLIVALEIVAAVCGYGINPGRGPRPRR